MVDKEGLLEHLREMDEALRDWERYRKTISLQDIKEDRDKRNMVLHALLVSIQASIDIANHLIVENSLMRPATYREAFEILSKHKIIQYDLGNELADLAGFRNIMVHIYWRLDIEEVFRIMQNGLKFLEDFRKIVKQFLDK